MSAPAKLDPAALVPGQRVRLYAADVEREGLPQDYTWTLLRVSYQLVFQFVCGKYSVRLIAVDDGTLRDGEGRIVEVRDGET